MENVDHLVVDVGTTGAYMPTGWLEGSVEKALREHRERALPRVVGELIGDAGR